MVTVTDRSVEFSVDDPEGTLRGVRLYQELFRPRIGPRFDRRGDRWRLSFPRPPADRMEYLLVVTRSDGTRAWVVDGTNPLRVEGVFGPKSVVELPGYAPPAWLDAPTPTSRRLPFDLRLGATPLPVVLWAPGGTDPEAVLPLLLVHDGPEYDTFARLLSFLAWGIARGDIPPLRAALLPPPAGRRDETYSANADYVRRFGELLQTLRWLAPHPADAAVAMGASLGALALLHVHWRLPHTFAGLFLQSGSFFRPRTDPQEQTFAYFDRVAAFVGEVLNTPRSPRTIPIRLTCGSVEENLANNRQVAAALDDLGHPVSLVTNRDGHSYTAWRDTFAPHLATFLAAVLGRVHA